MSCSRHKIRLTETVRDIRAVNDAERLVSEKAVQKALAEKFHNGYEAGQKTLSEQLVQQRAEILGIQTGVLRALQRALPEVVKDCEKALVEIALETAERVVGNIGVSAEMVEKTIQEAIEQVKGTTRYRVHLHREDLELLEKNQSSILPAPNSPAIQFVADESVSRGGCVVETQFGTINATRENKFKRIREGVLC